MNKVRLEKSIGWTDLTINPIKGMCKGGCWYCWTKPFYTMKRLQPEIRIDFNQFLKLPKKPKRIFLCSTHDLFGDWIPKNWRDNIFEYIRYWKRHTFQILTKMPENIDRPMPDNVWLGVSVTKSDEMWRLNAIKKIKAKVKFVSIEPMLSEIHYIPWWIKWIIIGKLTGYGKKYDPKKEWIDSLILGNSSRRFFLKNNLKDIWGPNLIQEFPKVGLST